MQVRTLGTVAAVIGGTLVWAALSPGSPTASGQGSGGTGGSSNPAAVLDSASTSTRGIVGDKINVVFPVVALSSLASKEGFATDIEYSQQAQTIHVYVNQINKSGGIHGRKINPIISYFDPTNETEMRALCKNWTQGSPAAFAVVDGLGTWEGVNQLCITQEGHTPMIGEWSTVTSWTKQGAPYLWWTGVDQSELMQALVNWGLSSGQLAGKKVGIIAGDDPSDQAALKQALLPDLERAGVTNPITATIVADPNETSQTNTEAPLVVQRMKSAGVQSLIPLIPFNVFFPVLAAQSDQQYYPRLLLSDYGSSVASGARAHPGALRAGARRAGGRDDADTRGHRRARRTQPGRLHSRGPELLRDVGQGLSQAEPRAIQQLHRQPGPDHVVVPGDPPLRPGRREGRSPAQPPHVRQGHGHH